MKTTKQIRCEAKKLFRWCLINDLLDETRTRRVAQQIIERKRRSYLVLLSEFRRLVRLDREAHTAEVATVAPLPVDLRKEIQTRLEHAYGPGINIQFAQEPALIGGMRIKVGSDVFDGSVQSELAALEKSFGITIARGRNGEIAPRSRTDT
jgi:F-type H+-transporting ATPase subunit delta